MFVCLKKKTADKTCKTIKTFYCVWICRNQIDYFMTDYLF